MSDYALQMKQQKAAVLDHLAESEHRLRKALRHEAIFYFNQDDIRSLLRLYGELVSIRTWMEPR